MGELTESGVFEATACDAALVLSELVSNSLRHASPLPGSVVKVSWGLANGYVEVAVSDGGGVTVPVVHRPTANALGGRGLGIVDRLSLRWGVFTRQGDGETTVWAALPLSGDEHPARRSMAENGARSHNDTGPDLVIAWSRE